METRKIAGKAALCLAAAGLFALPATAAANGFSLSLRASTLGLGKEIGYAINDYVNVRVSWNEYTYDYETTEDDIDYNFDLNLDSKAMLVDVHPFGGSFRITAGVLENRNALDGQAEAAGTYDFNGTTYAGEDIGILFSRVDLGEDKPRYVGLGFSQALGESGWGMGFDVGMVMMGESDVTLTPQSDSLVANPQFQADIAAEEAELEADLNNDFDSYPVVAFGVTYQF